MRILAAITLALACSSAGYAAEPPSALDRLLVQVEKEQPAVQWDAKSVKFGNFEGDGQSGIALLGVKQHSLYLVVAHASMGGSFATQYLNFAISANEQAAICALPARIEAYPLQCTSDGGNTLPGCIMSSGASVLSIVDDQCDPINVYWNHNDKHLAWWRN